MTAISLECKELWSADLRARRLHLPRPAAVCAAASAREGGAPKKEIRTDIDMSDEGRAEEAWERLDDGLPGIVIRDGRRGDVPALRPRIRAFIWGGKVRPTPTLPFGRWKGAA